MSIGLANIFGMDFDENFNYPYISKSITEFWRRWHITLGSWFRDYIYIPLGGNRKGFAKQIRKKLVVGFLTGMWHGASWNFILWGVYFGVILILEKLFILKILEQLPKFIRHLYAIFLILLGWVLFAFEDLTKVANYIKSMFNFDNITSIESIYYLRNYAVMFIIGIIFSIPFVNSKFVKLEKSSKKSVAVFITSVYILLFIFEVA